MDIEALVKALIDIYNSQNSDTPGQDMGMKVADLLSELGYVIEDDPDDWDRWIAVKKIVW